MTATRSVALVVLLFAITAHGQTTRPTLPPLNWKPKADAPGWVTEALDQYAKVREMHAKDKPERIAKVKEDIAKAQAGKVGPNEMTRSAGGKTVYGFKTQEAKNKTVAGLHDVLASFERSYSLVMNPDMLPIGRQPKDDKPLTEYVVPVDPNYKGTPKQPEKR